MSAESISVAAPAQSTGASNRVRWLVVTVIGITSAVRLWLIASSFFWQDDYVHAWKAWNLPAGDLVFQNWNGHVEVASMGLQWVFARLWPQSWLPVLLYLGALSICLPVLFWLCLRRLVGPTGPAVAALCLFAVWPGLALPQTWFSAGLELTWLACGLGALYAFAADWRGAGWWASLFVLIGFGFSERIVFTLPLVVTALLLVAQGSLVERLRSVWSAHRAGWLPLAATTAVLATAAWFFGRQDAQRDTSLSVAQWADGLRRAVVDGSLRGVTGWPVSWGSDRGTFPLPPSAVESELVAAVVIAMLLVAVRANRRQTLVIVVLAVPWLLLEPLLVMTSRSVFLTMVGSAMMMDARYLVPSTVAILLFIGTWRGKARPGVDMAFVRVVAGVAVVGGLVGLLGIAPVVDGSASRAWLATARESFIGAQAPPLASNGSPGFMLGTLFSGDDGKGHEIDYGTTRTLLDVGTDRPRFNVPTDFPLGADDSGEPAPVDAFPVKSSTPEGYGAQCSVTVGDAWVPVPMTEAGLGNPILGVDLLPTVATVVQVRAEQWTQTLRVQPGLRTAWFFPDPGPFAGFDIRVISGDTEMCVGRARAGQPFVVGQ